LSYKNLSIPEFRAIKDYCYFHINEFRLFAYKYSKVNNLNIDDKETLDIISYEFYYSHKRDIRDGMINEILYG